MGGASSGRIYWANSGCGLGQSDQDNIRNIGFVSSIINSIHGYVVIFVIFVKGKTVIGIGASHIRLSHFVQNWRVSAGVQKICDIFAKNEFVLEDVAGVEIVAGSGPRSHQFAPIILVWSQPEIADTSGRHFVDFGIGNVDEMDGGSGV